jgi:hypothetical protein
MVQVTCPKCRALSKFADADRGAVVACSQCGTRMRLPQDASGDPAPKRPRREDASADEPENPRDNSLAQEPEEESDPEQAPRKKSRKGRKLGPVEAEFRGSTGYLALQMIGISLLFLLGIWLLLMGLMAAAGGPNIGIGERLVGLLVFGILGGGITALGVWLLLRQLREWKKRVLLSQDGFAVILGGRRKVYHWDDIICQYQKITDNYVNGVYRNTSHVYTMECANGERIVFNDSLKKVEKLGDAIAEVITQRELPLALEDYDAGRLVSFGKLGVSKKGLTYGESFLSWKEIKGVQIAEGSISVSKKGKWFNWCSIDAAKVPNLFVFLALVDEIKGVKGM